ncbi:MAG: gliding motility-associated C-terminal domain-containing protein [Bacteroidales bacterium]|jgi:gliding motility-associated-like protein|nr:gliding motility-associated C-terminal domain-containing protein [Bacteroidales bacterium]
MNIRLCFFCILIFFISNTVYGQYEFIENKGQWDKNIKYKLDLGNGALFFEDNCLTFNFIDFGGVYNEVEQMDPHGYEKDLIRKGHAYRVNFINSNTPLFEERLPSADYNNYFVGNDPSKWVSDVYKYSGITYKNIYNGIDLIYYDTENGLKYDFIINPGGDPRDILLEYEGADGLFIENDELIIGTSISLVKEGKPYAFQIINGDTVVVPCNYILKGNQVRLNLSKSYDKTELLIIDPSLVFSTYSGSVADNWGFTATWDYSGCVYSAGIVFDVGYPVSVGAYQVNFAGGTEPRPGSTSYKNGCDVGIIKYNANGTQRLYATYLGGTSGQEMPHSLVVTEKNDLVIMGTTGSSDFPTTVNAYSRNFSRGSAVIYDNVIGFPDGVDIYVAKLSEDGRSLLASTYVGGTGNDGLNYKNYYSYRDPVTGINYVEQHGNDSLYFNYGDGARGEVIVDSEEMVYVGTSTFSTDFPSGINRGYQTSNGGGQDGVVFKLSSDMSQLVWSSYLGGTNDDAIFSICLDNAGDVLVTGGTVSRNFPVTQGAYNTSHNGGSTDAFISKLNPSGNVLLNSTYFGSDKYDNAFFVRTDKSDNVFICGQTKASGNTLVYNVGYYRSNSGQFITKFNSSLSSVIWSTVFGSGNGRPNISITAFTVDVCNRVYLSGWGREWTFSYYNAQGNYYTWDSNFGTKGMEVTSDAIQGQTDGQDFYIMVLGKEANRLEYATFFGELHYDGCSSSGRDHVDGGTARFDAKGNIIQSACGSCGSCQHFPVHPNPGAWSTTNRSSNCNDAVFKIRVIENLATANFDPVPAGCVPYNVRFNNTSQGTTYLWDFGDGTTSTQLNPSHIYSSGGEYAVRLIVNDPSSCNIADTIVRIVRVVQPGRTNLPDVTICSGENVIIGPSTNYEEGTTFRWSGGIGLSNTNVQNPVAGPSVTTIYTLVATGACVDTIIQKVIVMDPQINIITSNDTTICRGESVTIFASSPYPVGRWEWSDNSSFSNILSLNQNITVSPLTTTVYYVRANENICETNAVEQVVVNVHRFNYNLEPEHMLCYGNTTNLTVTNNNPADNLTYSWSPVSAIVSGANTNSPVVNPTTPTTFTVTVTNQLGCVSYSQVVVNIDNLFFSNPSLIHNSCYGDCNGRATVSANGIAPYSFLWDNSQTSATIFGLCSGTYSVTVTDANQCTAATNITITSPPQLLGNFIDVREPECDGIGYGEATVSPVGGTPGYSYEWSYNGNSGATNNQCLVGINTVTVTDANSCETVLSINMPSPSSLTAEISDYDMISCYGACDGRLEAIATLGQEPYTYNWSNGIIGEEISGLCAGAYTVTIIDRENCVFHRYMSLTQPDSLVVQAVIESAILCHGETGTIHADVEGGTEGYSYRWSNDSPYERLENIPVGIYIVTVTDANGCTDHSIVELTQPDKLVMSSVIKNMLCDNNCNGEISVSVEGGVTPYLYSWSNGISGEKNTKLCDGEYELIVKDLNNCILNDSYTIVNEGYVPDLSVEASEYEIFQGQMVRLLASSSQQGSYTWNHVEYLNDPYISNPIAKPLKETLFKVRFFDENGCAVYDTVRIKVKEVICTDPYIYVPTAFTPNNDGKNDYFKPYYASTLVTSIYFAVYDRWGNVIFQTDKLDNIGWDGTYKGEKLASDVYVFYLKAGCFNGEEYSHKGNVTLLR